MPEWRPVGVKTRREKKRDFQCAECNKGNVGKWSAKMAFSADPHLSSAERRVRRESEMVGEEPTKVRRRGGGSRKATERKNTE